MLLMGTVQMNYTEVKDAKNVKVKGNAYLFHITELFKLLNPIIRDTTLVNGISATNRLNNNNNCELTKVRLDMQRSCLKR